MSKQPTDRLQELDALRGIAAIIVLMFHYTVQYQELFGHVIPPPLTMPAGRYGVQLFFVISGFVIFLTLTRASSIWDFAANRLSRLYPPYWVCIGITFAIIACLPMPGLNVTGKEALINLTMLQYWLQTNTVDGVYWTLAVELAFYAFVSGLYLIGLLRRVELWVSVWLAMIFIVQLALRSGINISPMIRTALMLEHGHFFFAGVLFYRMRYDGFTAVRWLLVAVCVAAAWFVRDAPHALSLLISSLVFALFVSGRLGWIAVGPLLFLGDISYPLYLLHQHIGYAVIDRLQKAGLISPWWLLVPAAVAILLATAVNRAVEKPARQWLRARWKAGRLRKALVKDSASAR